MKYVFLEAWKPYCPELDSYNQNGNYFQQLFQTFAISFPFWEILAKHLQRLE